MRWVIGVWWVVGFVGAVWVAMDLGEWVAGQARDRDWLRTVMWVVAGVGIGWLVWGLLSVGTLVGL